MNDQQLYVIGVPGFPLAKIGISINPVQRLVDLAHGHGTIIPAGVNRRQLVVLHSQPGGRPAEKALHLHFQDRWVAGEWYNLGAQPVTQVQEALAQLHAAGVLGVEPARLGRIRCRTNPLPERRQVELHEDAQAEHQVSLRWLLHGPPPPSPRPSPEPPRSRPEPVRLDQITDTVRPHERDAMISWLHRTAR